MICSSGPSIAVLTKHVPLHTLIPHLPTNRDNTQHTHSKCEVLYIYTTIQLKSTTNCYIIVHIICPLHVHTCIMDIVILCRLHVHVLWILSYVGYITCIMDIVIPTFTGFRALLNLPYVPYPECNQRSLSQRVRGDMPCGHVP